MIWASQFIVEFSHDLMLYLTSHPGICWTIPVNRHVLYLHFVLFMQAMGVFRFTYDWQLSVVWTIHVVDDKQSKPVFVFFMCCRACRLVTIKAVSSVQQWLVKQSSFITIVKVIWLIPGKGREGNSFLPGLQFIIGGGWLLATTDYLVHHAIPVSPKPCQSGWPNSLAKLKVWNKYNVVYMDVKGVKSTIYAM